MHVKTMIFVASSLLLACGVVNGAELNWSVFADQTAQSSPGSETRSLRAIALDPESTTLYGSYINGSSSHAVKVYDAAIGSDTYGSVLGSFITSTGTAAAKAITVDDRGYIYTGRPDDSDAQIRIFESSYVRIASVPMSSFGHTKTVNGMDVVRNGSQYLLYTTGSSSSSGMVNRWDVTDPTNPVADTSFGSGGQIDLMTITGASSPTYLRGIEVTPSGVIYTASLDTGKVHRISADLSTAVSADVPRAHDVAVYGDRVYAVTYDGTDSRVYVLDALNLSLIEVLNPVAALGLDRQDIEGFSSIEIDANGWMYVADQVYKNESSTVSDRIFVAMIPEPGSLALIGLAGPLLIRRRRGG